MREQEQLPQKIRRAKFREVNLRIGGFAYPRAFITCEHIGEHVERNEARLKIAHIAMVGADWRFYNGGGDQRRP